MITNNKPNFLVVGAAKSGTTNLFHLLTQHPDIFIPDEKECRYFSQIGDRRYNPYTKNIIDYTDVISNSDDYYKLYKNTDKYKAKGDISNDYLYYYNESISRIKTELGSDVKIIIILRNPANRAFSQYQHLVRDELTETSFEDMLKQEKDWYTKDIWWCFFLKDVGFYSESVKAYMDNFPKIKVLLFEEFIKDQDKYLKEICEFLEVDPGFQFKEPEVKNKTGAPKNKMLNHILMGNVPFRKTLKKIALLFLNEKEIVNKITKARENNLEKTAIHPETKAALAKQYASDIAKLEKLLNRDLSLWK